MLRGVDGEFFFPPLPLFDGRASQSLLLMSFSRKRRDQLEKLWNAHREARPPRAEGAVSPQAGPHAGASLSPLFATPVMAGKRKSFYRDDSRSDGALPPRPSPLSSVPSAPPLPRSSPFIPRPQTHSSGQLEESSVPAPVNVFLSSILASPTT